jgi:predicted transcriptional regulator
LERSVVNLRSMEVRLAPEVENKLRNLATESGRGTDELVEDALAIFLDEVAQTRDMLNSRYDDLKSGRAKPIDGEEAFSRLRANTEAQRNR